MNHEDPFCRICLSLPQDETLMPTDADFCQQIQACTGISPSQSFGWPHKICTSCALLLRAALKLRSLCQKAEDQLLAQQKLTLEEPESEPLVEEMEMPLESYEITLSANESSTDPVIDIRPTASSFACTQCLNVYKEKVKLTAHLKVHSKHKPHECEICHKRFRQTPQLARHMNSHTGLRPYKCDYCESRFADPSTRIKHQRIHTNERPYKCQLCDKTFAYSNVLSVHLKTHTGERPFSCEYCGRWFSQLHHKNTHERAHLVQKVTDHTVVTLVEEE